MKVLITTVIRKIKKNLDAVKNWKKSDNVEN